MIFGLSMSDYYEYLFISNLCSTHDHAVVTLLLSLGVHYSSYVRQNLFTEFIGDLLNDAMLRDSLPTLGALERMAGLKILLPRCLCFS